MNDGATLTTYGNTVLRKGTEDRPLVTFAVFAYNQEKYIHEAVEAAFAQTYSPLEIILSDDCSSDNTFFIIQDMARNYQGPHLIRIRRQSANEGLLNHVCSVASEVNGEIIVMAAGDDISSPDRVEALISEWTPECIAMDSACALIDENGNILKNKWRAKGDAKQRLPWLKKLNSDIFVYGASSAYHRSIIKALRASNFNVYSEDTPLNIIAQLHSGRICRCDRVLVQYRAHQKSISSTGAYEMPELHEIKRLEDRRFKEITVQRDIYRYVSDTLAPALTGSEKIDLHELQRLINFCDIRLKWYEAGFFNRICLALVSPKQALLWMLPRLFGRNFYAILKLLSLRLTTRNRSLTELKM